MNSNQILILKLFKNGKRNKSEDADNKMKQIHDRHHRIDYESRIIA